MAWMPEAEGFSDALGRKPALGRIPREQSKDCSPLEGFRRVRTGSSLPEGFWAGNRGKDAHTTDS